jgi:intergrase/recombinase
MCSRKEIDTGRNTRLVANMTLAWSRSENVQFWIYLKLRFLLHKS